MKPIHESEIKLYALEELQALGYAYAADPDHRARWSASRKTETVFERPGLAPSVAHTTVVRD